MKHKILMVTFLLIIFSVLIVNNAYSTEFSDDSTDLGNVENMSKVRDFTLASKQGAKIKWLQDIDMIDVKYQDNVMLGKRVVAVNSKEVEKLNILAEVTLNGINCDQFGLYYIKDFVSKEDLFRNGKIVATQNDLGKDCSDNKVCTQIKCANNKLTFIVSGFSGFGVDYNETGTFIKDGNSTTRYSLWNGTYINTTYEDTIPANIINSSDLVYTGGTWESQIFDAGSSVVWNNISICKSPYGNVLDNNQNETNKCTGNIDMSKAVLVLHFDDLDNITKDSSINQFNGTIINPSYYKNDTGIIGSAIGFSNDTGSYLSYGNALPVTNLTEPIFFSVWINAHDTQSATNFRLLGHGDFSTRGFSLTESGNIAYLRFYPVAHTTTATNAFQQDTWRHFVGGYNGTHTLLYINGVLADSDAVTNYTSPITTDKFVIGATNGGAWTGNHTYDEFIYFNRSLSDDEVKWLYLRGHGDNNVSYMTCNDAACSGETYSSQSMNTAIDINSENRYFRYKVFSWQTYTNQTASSLFRPYFINATVRYTESGHKFNYSIVPINHVINLIPLQVISINVSFTSGNVSLINTTWFKDSVFLSNLSNITIVGSTTSGGTYILNLTNGEMSYLEQYNVTVTLPQTLYVGLNTVEKTLLGGIMIACILLVVFTLFMDLKIKHLILYIIGITLISIAVIYINSVGG